MADFRWLTIQETQALVERVTRARISQSPYDLNRLLNGIDPGYRAQFLPDLDDLDRAGVPARLERHCENLSVQEPLADNSVPIAIFLANVTNACYRTSLPEAAFRDLLRRCLAVARETGNGVPQDDLNEKGKWENAARYIEGTIEQLPPSRPAQRMESITTETIGWTHGSPGASGEPKGPDELAKLIERGRRVTEISEVMQGLNPYIAKYKEALEPLMCCENVVKATEKLRGTIEYVEDAEWANAARARWAFAAKANEISDLLAQPCVDALRGWAQGIQPQVNGISAEILERYEQCAEQARSEAVELTNAGNSSDRRQLLAVVRKLSTHALIMKSAWQVPHDAVYMGIVSRISSMSAIIGIKGD